MYLESTLGFSKISQGSAKKGFRLAAFHITLAGFTTYPDKSRWK